MGVSARVPEGCVEKGRATLEIVAAFMLLFAAAATGLKAGPLPDDLFAEGAHLSCPGTQANTCRSPACGTSAESVSSRFSCGNVTSESACVAAYSPDDLRGVLETSAYGALPRDPMTAVASVSACRYRFFPATCTGPIDGCNFEDPLNSPYYHYPAEHHCTAAYTLYDVCPDPEVCGQTPGRCRKALHGFDAAGADKVDLSDLAQSRALNVISMAIAAYKNGRLGEDELGAYERFVTAAAAADEADRLGMALNAIQAAGEEAPFPPAPNQE